MGVSCQLTDEQMRAGVGAALGRIPSGLFILTARYEDRRSGILSSWVQQVSFEPAMVSVAIAKGRPIMPLVSESRQFGLCQLPEGDKVYLRKFAAGIDPNEDPFLGFDLIRENRKTCVPILANVLSYVECEVAAHMDVDGDHDLFIGRVIGGQCFNGKPFVHIRENGFKY